MRVPAAKNPAAHQNPVVYPCTAAWARTVGVGCLPARSCVVAVAARVLRSARPSDPPIWLVALTSPEATPASPGSTPRVAMSVAGAYRKPSPTPRTISAGSRCAA